MIIDAVLPVSARDVDRMVILLRSLERFFTGLGTCFVVAPDGDVDAIRARAVHPNVEVLADSELVPAVQARRRSWAMRRLSEPGWVVQQLVKLAAAERVSTDSYITLDADVVLLRRLSARELFDADGRALVQLDPYDENAVWYRWTEKLLGVSGSGRMHGVTPAVLRREAVRELIARLEELRRASRRPRDLLARRRPSDDWRAYLLRHPRWTEYSLYHTHLESTGRFDLYHAARPAPLFYDTDRSVWFAADFERWNPAQDMRRPDAPYFAVVQSRAGIEAPVVWERVASLIEASD